MEPRTRYQTYLLIGIVMLIVTIADLIKGIPTSFRINHFDIGPILLAALFFGMAIRAKRETPRLR
jgi:hypothetical protein